MPALEPGNIDLTKRPVVRNADGTISTVRSMSFEEDGAEVLIPTVSDDGRIMEDKEAIAYYHKTGRHLGKFSTPEEANAYAEQLHEEQAEMYGGGEHSSLSLEDSLMQREASLLQPTGIGLGMHVGLPQGAGGGQNVLAAILRLLARGSSGGTPGGVAAPMPLTNTTRANAGFTMPAPMVRRAPGS